MFTLLLLFMLSIISTGFSQEVPSILKSPVSNDNVGTQNLWPLQNLQGGRGAKPCSRRSNKNDGEEPWIPSFTSRIAHPIFDNTVLQPQALKNQKLTPEVGPKIEILSKNYPDRRSLGDWNINAADSYEKDFDRLKMIRDVDQPESKDVNNPVLKPANVEKTAHKLIEDCLLKQKQNNKDPITIPVGSSRRSMSNSGDGSALFGNEADSNNYQRELNSNDLNQLNNKIDYGLEINRDGSRSAEGLLNNYKSRNTNQLKTKLIDPEISTGIANNQAVDIRPKNARICYACSTATNPTCQKPDNSTTVKYCTREKSCAVKTFGPEDSLTTIRDCANSCEDSSVPGIDPKYKSCNLCHNDYCNAAISINGYNLLIVLIIGIIKCTF